MFVDQCRQICTGVCIGVHGVCTGVHGVCIHGGCTVVLPIINMCFCFAKL